MPNPLAMSIMNNIVNKEMKGKAKNCRDTAIDRLTNREEELLTKLIHNKLTITNQSKAIPTADISSKAITLDALVARCIKKELD